MCVYFPFLIKKRYCIKKIVMQKIIILTFLSFFFLQNAFGLTLVVEINDFKNDKGQALIAVFDKKDGFPTKQAKALRRKIGTIKNGKTTVIFENLPEGEYAVAVVHDTNKNEKINYNLMGAPTEGYGFSNINHPGLWVPAFSKSTFALSETRQTIKVKLYYSPFS